MDQRPREARAERPGANPLARLEILERRVLALVEELHRARAEREQAVTAAEELRIALRARVRALLDRVEKLEREA